MNAQVQVREEEQITLEEAVQLGAVDSEFFGQFFFSKTCRQASPPFHREMDTALDDPENRFVDCMVFRGGAKTSKLRLLTAKRISYGLARTIVFVGKSQEHAVKSVSWLKNAVKRNSLWAESFGLKPGGKWADTEIEIIHDVLDIRITVVALGITGSVRGVNIDDYRPDLIVVDDPCDEENTATAEQRKKISDLFFGALQKSLAPASEAPHAKMVLLQTVLDDDDLISVCQRDSQWKSLTFSCFGADGQSIWPERWTTEELLKDKQAHVERNQLSLWLREMECRVVGEEGNAFLPQIGRAHV